MRKLTSEHVMEDARSGDGIVGNPIRTMVVLGLHASNVMAARRRETSQPPMGGSGKSVAQHV